MVSTKSLWERDVYTNVVEGAQRAVGPAHHHVRRAQDGASEKVAGVCQLLHSAHHLCTHIRPTLLSTTNHQ